MTNEKDPFELEGIPDYAFQPAKEADEYGFHYVPRGTAGRFDPAAYEKILYDSVRTNERQEQSEMLEEILPVAFSDHESIAAEPAAIAEPVSEEAPYVQDLPEALELTEAHEEGPEAELTADEEELIDNDTSPQEELMAWNEPAAPPRPVFKPVVVPRTAPAKIVPMLGSTISSRLRFIDKSQKEPFRIYLEEDILVPDIKPDMARILELDGKILIDEKEIHTGRAGEEPIKLTGELALQAVYVPEHRTDSEPLLSIESKIPFRYETELEVGSFSDLVIVPHLESIDYTIVNERKFKVKASLTFGVREYRNIDVEVFEGFKEEDVQLLKEKIRLTDVAIRKKEAVEVKEELALKENMPEILKILKYDVAIAENHKQITKEKAVINATVFCNVMYLGQEKSAESAGPSAADADQDNSSIPVFFQGKTEFTQFIRLDGEPGASDQNPAGSKTSFDLVSMNISPKEDENGRRTRLALDLNLNTGLEISRNLEKEVVVDSYHHKKDIQFETEEIEVHPMSGSGTSEISVREIVNVPERYGNVDRIVSLSGKINEKRTFIDQNRCISEGIITVGLICTAADANKTVFSLTQEIPFRGAAEIPGITPDMQASNDIVLKDLWYDKINQKQIEVNAGLLLNTTVSGQQKYQLLKNIGFVERENDGNQLTGIVLYLTKPGDTIWNIAKKYRTTIGELKKINDFEIGKEIKPGTKLLIVAKID